MNSNIPVEYNKFLDRYRNVIDQRDFIYPDFIDYYGTPVWTKLLSDLYKLGVNPLDNLTRIPKKFFFRVYPLYGIEIPFGVKEIGEHAFAECTNLTSVMLPSSLEEVGTSAFASCRNLRQIHYCGLKEQWYKIRFSRYWIWEIPKGQLKVECFDGEIIL